MQLNERLYTEKREDRGISIHGYHQVVPSNYLYRYKQISLLKLAYPVEAA